MELTVFYRNFPHFFTYLFCWAIPCLLTHSPFCLLRSTVAWCARTRSRVCLCAFLMPFTLFFLFLLTTVRLMLLIPSNHSITPNDAKNFSTVHSFNQQALFVYTVFSHYSPPVFHLRYCEYEDQVLWNFTKNFWFVLNSLELFFY